MAELPRCRQPNWADIDRWAARVAQEVLGGDAVPETIVGLTRGGWVPARILADLLGVRRLVSLRAQHWGVTATPDGAASVTEGLSGPVDEQNVLVVDDITDTGESLALAVKHVHQAGAERIETATLLHIGHSRFVPTYFAEEIPRNSWAWIVFPWNYWEDLRSLAARAAVETPGLDAVRQTLREKCGLDIPVEDLERVARTVPLDGSKAPL
jgi:uncharacterized protein